jgi:hypothetical protein
MSLTAPKRFLPKIYDICAHFKSTNEGLHC